MSAAVARAAPMSPGRTKHEPGPSMPPRPSPTARKPSTFAAAFAFTLIGGLLALLLVEALSEPYTGRRALDRFPPAAVSR